MKTLKKILIVLTNHAVLGNSGKPTGVWLSEFVHFYNIVTAAGLSVTLASPRGGTVPIDPASAQSVDSHSSELLNSTTPISEIDSALYAAIYFPGGHGPMWDLANDHVAARVTRDIYENGGIVSTACHGPAALLPVILSDGTHLLAQHTVTGFTNLEETLSMKKKWMPFLLEDELKRVSKKYTKGFPWFVHYEISGRIVTGQNPASVKPVAQAVVQLLT